MVEMGTRFVFDIRYDNYMIVSSYESVAASGGGADFGSTQGWLKLSWLLTRSQVL